MSAATPRLRLRLTCRGVVQGVGFRPAVHRLATGLGLAGFVRNDPDGAAIEVEGPEAQVRAFAARLPASLPPLARLAEVEEAQLPATGAPAFAVEESAGGQRRRALVPPDAALCPDCRSEMERPGDRRHRYPFTTCTNCGPRFTLATCLPYDRARTSMACFPLCAACAREYADPADRRFHAEPICCPLCGPRLWFVDRRGRADRASPGPPDATAASPPERDAPAGGAAALRLARQALADGAIVALKGLGGFQLACRADDAAAVARLRERKRRPAKPFAVMARDLAAARRLLELGAEDEALLLSSRAPIVLAPRRGGAGVAAGVAPGLADLGVMLPTTPLHVELFRDLPVDVLVMTSGNASDEPICRGNREALARLSAIADGFLLHDRDVVRRADDSVARGGLGRPVFVRRGRGCVPESFPLPVAAPLPVLALGAFLQNAACLATADGAFVSQHVGDLDSEPAREFLREVVAELEEFLESRGETVAVDAHPDYPSTWLGEEIGAERAVPLVRVQHHLAHAAAVLAEHDRFPSPGVRAAAIVLDGTGWGPDGTAWGGEWLLLDGDLSWRRLARLAPLPLVGGEAAVREPWRVLAASLARAGAADLLGRLPIARLVPHDELATVARLAAGSTWPLASGAGRLFEAAGAMFGLVAANSYEGEAAARCEALAAGFSAAAEPWPELEVAVDGPRPPTGAALSPARAAALPELPGGALLLAAAHRLLAGKTPTAVAAGFHATFCRLAARLARRVIPRRVSEVAVGGGCLVNRLLRRGLAAELAAAGFEPLLPFDAPPGDGGIAYGQAVLASVGLARGTRLNEEGS